jgi:hypothetical protein
MSDAQGPNMSHDWLMDIGTKLVNIYREERNKTMAQVKLIDQSKPYGQNVNRLEDGFHELEVHDVKPGTGEAEAVGWVELEGVRYAVSKYPENAYFQQVGIQ